jgi:integrase
MLFAQFQHWDDPKNELSAQWGQSARTPRLYPVLIITQLGAHNSAGGTHMAATGTRGRKYHSGAHIMRMKGRPGWFIRWVEPRGETLVIPYTPGAGDPQLDVRAGKHGCIVVTNPPAKHPLHRQIKVGDTIVKVGEVRVHDSAQLAQALTEYTDKAIGLRVKRGKSGNTYRWKKAGDTRDEAEAALGQFLVNRDREKAGLPVNHTPAGYSFQQLADETTEWAQSPLSGYSKSWAYNVLIFLRVHARRWGHMSLADITPALLGQWADKRATEVSGSGLGNEIKALRAAFKLAVLRQYTTTDPTAGMMIPKPRAARPKYLTEEQLTMLLECARAADAHRLEPSAVAPYNTAIMRKWYNADGTFDTVRVRFLLMTGLRKAQLTSLTWQQYDAKRGAIVLESRPDHSEKSKRVNVIPLPREARVIIEGQPQGAPYIFSNLRGGRDVQIGNRMARIFASVQERGGGHIHLHLLRHTALTALLKHTHDIAAVQRYAGHADVKTTTRYAWILDDELKAMTEDFNPVKSIGDPGAAPAKSV